ncbi:MAG: phage holin family protein [Microcystaceae cyanobacterium]
MPQFLITWLITAVSLLITAFLIPGITLSSFTVAAIAAVALGLVNAIVRPILILFTLPLTILTLGLFLLIVNAISFNLAAYFIKGFSINSFFDAIIGSIILSIISGFLSNTFNSQES